MRERATAEPVPLDVLYEDDALIAVNKPAGMVVHPSFRNRSGTLLNGVLWRVRDRKDIRPGLVSRLDKDTSGVVVVALSPGVHASIQRDARAARVSRNTWRSSAARRSHSRDGSHCRCGVIPQIVAGSLLIRQVLRVRQRTPFSRTVTGTPW
jgi:23S rRNA-/tRNA-specific pseudouridylate synthase